MALDLQRDGRRLRWGLVLAAMVLLAAMIIAAVLALSPGWRGIQAGLPGQVPDAEPIEPGIRQVTDCAGQVDRCATCHLRAAGPGRVDDAPQPYRAHPPRPACRGAANLGCGTCHGGTPRALDAVVAHGLPGGPGADPLMKSPHVQAACGRCHVPGAVPGSEKLAAGALRYLQLGCPVCHPLGHGGKGGAAFGPDLRATGRLDLAYLTTSLVDPAANFAGSDMPSFRNTFADHPAVLTELLIYLQSLALSPLPGCAPGDTPGRMVGRACVDCHGGTGGRAAGRMQHTCTYILDRAAELSCSGCHPGQVPAQGPGNGYCPVVRQHRSSCVACHRTGASGGQVGTQAPTSP